MKFERSISICCTPEEVFAFLRDKDEFEQEPDSPVLSLDKTTPGKVKVGTEYVEIVQMFPFLKGVIYSEIQLFEPPKKLEESFRGTGMDGYLAYEFIPEGKNTLLVQREDISFHGVFRLFSPIMNRMLLKAVEARLKEIKFYLENKKTQGTD
ncbi:MAG TPA: SRPBCC family protein [Anaerolineaceae bacterium]|nr:SRPBCC family protein [Anaerolineaceae bacterium]